MKGVRVAILGATGLVGQKILEILAEREFPVKSLTALATEGHGRTVQFRGEEVPVRGVESMDWSSVDVAFFAASTEASRTYAPIATAHGVTVVDKSSYFRMDPLVPLVVPEVNIDAVGDARLIASPNCSTIQMVVALEPIRREYGLKRVIVSTYQAVSGTGREAMETLTKETHEVLEHQKVIPTTYPTPIAFNVLPYCDKFGDDDYTGEEWKLTRETQKIFRMSLPVSATAVRVPVYISHAESVYIETEKSFELSQVRELLARSPGLRVVDDPSQGLVPIPLDAADQDLVLVGRIRRDLFVDNGLHMFVVADNLRKGAATNAIQIVESLMSRWA
ncbi:aspartate-semialdehyde dehydrogenase [Sulfobacillus thermosulfidooxidans]|uniref:aspartate-semialdehyde dehydrogenase n=1 Tax=Sulfobacillus thermosulfidooxidans TaxID=28034 RepID=UPI0006B55886|nr:aspartate-semialdehyde dehydrogenase [Sulfobacillus thermosulfidooxidans]